MVKNNIICVEIIVRCEHCGNFLQVWKSDADKGNYTCPCQSGRDDVTVRVVKLDHKNKTRWVTDDTYACICEARVNAMAIWSKGVVDGNIDRKNEEIGVLYDFLS